MLSLRQMRRFWWKLPYLRGLTPLQRGYWEAGLVVSGLAILLWVAFEMWSVDPTPGVLSSLAEIGATLLIAYVIEISWLVRASRTRRLEERESRLGALTGVGYAGLLGIGASLALSERATAHHWTWLDGLGFGFAVGSLAMLGLMVVMQPMLTHEWMDDDKRAQSTDG
jgi:hypothetical protein